MQMALFAIAIRFLTRSGRVCPKGKTHKDAFSLNEACVPRDQEETLRLLAQAAKLEGLAAKQEFLKEFGLNWCPKPYWQGRFCRVYSSILFPG